MRAVIALLIVSTFAYLAVSQNQCSTAPAGCTSCAGGLTAIPNQCTQCGSGYLLVNTISSCTVGCGSGCWTCTNTTVCLVCQPGWVLYAAGGVCVQFPTGCTAGTATNTTSASINCTATWANYTLISNTAFPCFGSSAISVGTASWNPIPNCVACSGTATSNKLMASGTPAWAGNWVTCSQCAVGYLLVPAVTQTGSITTGDGVSTPECIPTGAALTATTLGTGSGNFYVTGDITAAKLGGNVGCAQATLTISGTPTLFVSAVCTMAANTYWCPTGVTLAGGAVATQCQSSAVTNSIYPTTIPANCTGGMLTTNTTLIICQWCTNSSFYLTAAATAGNSCVMNNASCLVQVSATNCTVAAAGFTITSTGAAVACSNTTTACTGGLLTNTFLTSAGNTMTGAGVVGCAYHNTTANSTSCVQCANFVSSIQNCTACSQYCATCAMASGVPSCSVCNSGYQLLTAPNGTSGCAVPCPNGTNRTSNGSCYSKNMIASAVAFASFVFYYIF